MLNQFSDTVEKLKGIALRELEEKEEKEVQQIKALKEKFAPLRDEIVGQSVREIGDVVSDYRFVEREKKSCEEKFGANAEGNVHYSCVNRYLSLVQNPSIREKVLENLEFYGGFDKEKAGTQYLASLITIFFHERKLYRREDVDRRYWDLYDWNNEHYEMLGHPKEKVISDILDAMDSSEWENGTHEELIYEMADQYGYLGHDRDDEDRKPYTDMLKEKPVQKKKA